MTLHAVVREGEKGKPWLIFLHGFSGDAREWQQVGEQLSVFPRLYINLPGHGASAHIPGEDFEHVCQQLGDTLLSYNIQNYWLIGYSLGGRVAMHFACQQKHPGLKGLIVEGAHPGLQDEKDRSTRQASDLAWARRFSQESLAQVFDDWYRQPVFSSLDEASRNELVALRACNYGISLAEMLMATSLAVQPDLRTDLAARDYSFWYLCGEHDRKFHAVAQSLNATCTLVSQAGHNAHRENPAAVANCLAKILQC